MNPRLRLERLDKTPTVSYYLPFAERSVNWEDFEAWLLRDHKPRIARDMVSYAKRYCHYLFERDFSELKLLSDGKRRHVLKSLSALAKYFGIYEDFKRLVRNYGVKWVGKSSADILIERLTKIANPNEVFEWIKEVKKACSKLEVFMDFMAVTGLRLNEAVMSYNLIIDLARENRLSEYYSEVNECLEHFKFKEFFIRRTKKAFVSFIPKELVRRIAENEKLKSYYAVKKAVHDGVGKQRFGDIREVHATLLTKYLKQPEIDFLHGRVSTSIFMQHYFNPALISDLKQRVFKAISEIKHKISA